MLITKEIKISIGSKNLLKYRKLGYECTVGDIINIKIEELYKKSILKIDVKCDICGIGKNIIYSSYQKSIEFDGLYYCMKCSGKKRKKITLEKFGVENISQLQKIKEKKKQTNLKNWGAENVFQNDKIKSKSKKTKLKKYGNENYTNREKSWKTCTKNYGVKFPMQSENIKETRNKNNKEKYGVEHYTQTQQYINDVKITNNKKYDKNWYMETLEFKEKSKITNIDKYGVEYVMQNVDIVNKMIKTKIKNGHYLSDEQLTCYKKYANEVRRLTKKVKKELFSNWDGYDYYDGEWIAENLQLYHTKKEFPTIDHKISIYYGFHNNIKEKDIADIKNLCITKNHINSTKNRNNFYIKN